jgi:hypothetical protein
MPGTAPYQLLIDLAPFSSVIGTSGTVTVTTDGSHGITPGAYVEVAGLTGAGTAYNGTQLVTSVTSGSAFTFVSGTTSGTATITSGALSYDLLNPRINYAAGTAQSYAWMVLPETLSLSANGDGSGSSMSFTVYQDLTPPVGPWYTIIPDNARVRLAEKNTGSTPGTADARFLGVVLGTNSRLNESGQGSETDVSLGDVNILLDRLGTFGKVTATKGAKKSGASRASNVATINTTGRHAFVVGQQVLVKGFSGGKATSYNGIKTISGTPTTSSITYANTGAADTSGSFLTITPSRSGSSKDRLTLTSFGAPASNTHYHNLSSGDTIYVRGISAKAGTGWSNDALVATARLANGYFSGDQVIVKTPYQIELVLPAPIPGTLGTQFNTGAYLFGSSPQVGPPVINGQIVVSIAPGSTETEAVTSFLSLVNAYKADDPIIQRSFNTAGTAYLAGGTVYSNTQEVRFSATTLRSSLDAVIEAYTGNDVKERRYYIDVNGALHYELVDAEAKPTYSSAPYVITTNALGTPNTSTAKASVNPFSFEVGYDHDMTKAAMFTIPSTSGVVVSQIFSYADLVGGEGSAAFSTRKGAPTFDGFVDFPTAVKNPGAQLQRAAVAWMTERHKTQLQGSFELRGGGTAAWNSNGFSAGYAQTGTASFALVSGWRPGQWVEVDSALIASGLYRVEEVSWGLEPGSYVQRIKVSFNRKNPSDLASLIANKTK